MKRTEDFETACTVPELKRDRLREHKAGQMLLVVAWINEGPWAASGLCPHNFARLVDGRIEHGRLHCPRHQASFCLATGAADDRWQIDDLTLFPTIIEDGLVKVSVG